MTDFSFGDFSIEGFGVDGFPPLDPSPDEDAWEAFLGLALEQLGGDPKVGLSNQKLAELEAVIGATLPFEVGMLLVMGVPDDPQWWQWQNPAEDWSRWQASILDGLLFDVEFNGLWLDDWGQADEMSDRLAVAAKAVEAAPSLFPLWGHRAIPLTPARDETSSDSNPVLSVMQSDVIVYGTDLAAWLHQEFDVPLPMWPPTADRWFPFWSELG